MKKYCILLLMLSVTILVSCSLKSDEYTINLYDTINDKTYTYQVSKSYFLNNDLITLENSKFDFLGWCFSEDASELLINDIKYYLDNNVTLYSKWLPKKIDYNAIFNIDEVATFFINVSDPITSKEDYVKGEVGVDSQNYKMLSTPAKIRLRGNSSLDAPKKSYKVKFEEKQDVFGMGEDKEWALIANYYDSSLLRNYYAYNLALAMEIPYSVETKMVELYLNGVNQGLYLFCETVKTGSNRVNIEEEYDATAEEIPFLLELDYKMIEQSNPQSNGVINVDYFLYDNAKNNNKRYPIATKYPDDYTIDSITNEQYNYIKTYVANVFTSVKTVNYDKYLDIKSVINYFMIQELFMNIDQDYSSIFMYKPLNEKLKFGPVWDFDISTGNCNYVNNYNPYNKMKNVNGGSYIFYELMKHSNFYNTYKYYLEELGKEIFPAMIESFDFNYNVLKEYAATDNRIWNTLNSNFWPKPQNLVGISYYGQVDYLKSYLNSHYNWMLLNM